MIAKDLGIIKLVLKPRCRRDLFERGSPEQIGDGLFETDALQCLDNGLARLRVESVRDC